MKQLIQWPESRVCPRASDSRPVHHSLKRMQSPGAESYTGTEGLAANVDRVLRRIGWSWENALEVKTEEGEKLHITQCPEGYWKHRIRKQHENGGSDKQQTEKQQKIWRNLTSKCPLDC